VQQSRKGTQGIMDLQGRFLRMRRAGLRLRRTLAVRFKSPAAILAVTLTALVLLVLGALFMPSSVLGAN